MDTEVLYRLFAERVAIKPEFFPQAYYIDALDTLVVVEDDCSTTLEHVTGTQISLHIRNHEVRGKRNHVGFEVGGIKKFCRQNGIPFGEEMDLVQILRKMADLNKVAVPAIFDIAIPLVKYNKITSVIF